MARLLLLLLPILGAVAIPTFEEKLEDPSFSLFRLAVLSTYSADNMPQVTGALFPTDEAFDSVPEGILGWFFSNPSALKSLVDFHLFYQEGQTFDSPKDLVWQTITTLEGSVLKALMVEGNVVVTEASNSIASGRNIAAVDEQSVGPMFETNRVLFPETLVPCQSSKECNNGTNCRWYSQPTPDSVCGSPDVTPGDLIVNFRAADCQALATCQSCSSSMGGTCNNDAECCGLAQCGQSGCCAPIGTSCDTAGVDSTCCTGTCGDANTCCLAGGEDCTHTAQCCKGPCIVDERRKNHRICYTEPLVRLGTSGAWSCNGYLNIPESEGTYVNVCGPSRWTLDFQAADLGALYCAAAGCGSWSKTNVRMYPSQKNVKYMFKDEACTVVNDVIQVRDDCMNDAGYSCSAGITVECNDP